MEAFLCLGLNLQEVHAHCARNDGGVVYTYLKWYRRASYKSLYDGLVGIFDSDCLVLQFPISHQLLTFGT